MQSGEPSAIDGLAHIRILNGKISLNGLLLADTGTADPAALYRALGFSYPKFFKMDSLCKWAWLGAEVLLMQPEGRWRYDGLDKRNIALVLATKDGCLEVDHKFQDSMSVIPSPALFVYTLPNIMLGEICIRHGFTGEQLCQVQEGFEPEEILFWVLDLVQHRGATHCLFGWADVVGAHHDISLFWADANTLKTLEHARLQAVHNKPV